MLVRGDSLSKSMSYYLVERIKEIPNIQVIPNAELARVEGDDRLSKIFIQRHDLGVIEERDAKALFIFIGAEPHTQWLEGTLVRDEKGFLITGANLLKEGKKPANWKLQREPYLLETNIPGVFAVGDARDGAVRRVANSVGEGSIVLYFIRQHLANR
jgi:thioredoxin reductase (NADPH)